jgi:predicted  nucleic acid-binding Zn ribbon protein
LLAKEELTVCGCLHSGIDLDENLNDTEYFRCESDRILVINTRTPLEVSWTDHDNVRKNDSVLPSADRL